MPYYRVTMLVEFSGEIEADSVEEAEELAIYDQTCNYSGVVSVDAVEEETED